MPDQDSNTAILTLTKELDRATKNLQKVFNQFTEEEEQKTEDPEAILDEIKK